MIGAGCRMWNASDFLLRRRVVQTGCTHPPVTLRFVVTGADASSDDFTVELRGAEARADASAAGPVAHTVHCSAAEFADVVEGRRELLGPFWQAHLPREFGWAPSLYAFLYPDHPYARLSPVLGRIYRDSRYYPTVTPFTQGYRLYDLVRRHGLRSTFEVGLAHGGSALFLAAAHRDNGSGRHEAADPCQRSLYHDRALRFIEEAGLSAHFAFRPVTSSAAFRRFAAEGRQFDLIYVDGDHGLGAVLADLLGAHRCLRVGGYLAFDDSHFPSGRRVLRMIDRHFRYSRVPGDSTDRLTLLKKDAEQAVPLRIRAAALVRGSELLTRAALKVAQW